MTVFYLRGLRKVIFQQNNGRRHDVCRVLTYFETQGVQLLVKALRPLDSSTAENIWLWVADRLTFTIDEVWYGLGKSMEFLDRVCHPNPVQLVTKPLKRFKAVLPIDGESSML
ncbi:hypothetical protein TNCV_5129271 [Trichonephila clavipes]|nr:hypothetical protein TNCV_5129271 [Trichonephila clavipes]